MRIFKIKYRKTAKFSGLFYALTKPRDNNKDANKYPNPTSQPKLNDNKITDTKSHIGTNVIANANLKVSINSGSMILGSTSFLHTI